MQNFVSTNIVKQQELIDKSKLWNKIFVERFPDKLEHKANETDAMHNCSMH